MKFNKNLQLQVPGLDAGAGFAAAGAGVAGFAAGLAAAAGFAAAGAEIKVYILVHNFIY